ncbi:MAG: TSUP family transporter [Chitinivibrionales bacterium]|nr:TSUP family transporter [Chitinivibrionales bacterium]
MVIVSITLLTIVAGGVGTLTGFGTSTIMVPVLLLFLPLPQTLLLVGIVHWFGDIWKVVLFRSGLSWKLILAFGLAGIVASYLGARVVFAAPERLLSRILGGFLLAYVVFLFAKPAFKVPGRTLTAMTGGALSGFLAGIFGVGGAVRSAFLTAFDLPKAVYLSTAGAIALFIDTTRIATYLLNDVRLEPQYAWGFVLFVPASFLGAGIAKRMVDRIPQKRFRLIVAAFLFLAGLKLLLFPG